MSNTVGNGGFSRITAPDTFTACSPLVTIVTPSYNQGRFIRATIESVLKQDYPRIEYLIIDGGSSDDTADVVREYSNRLTWISEKDRGQSHAINKGFSMARGEIVAWLNSDDTILPGAVWEAVRAFERRPEAGAVYGEGYQIDIDGQIKSRFPHTSPFNLWKLVYLSDYILQQTVFFRKVVLDEVGYLDETLHWGMDWDLFIRIGKRYPLEYIPSFMGCLREYEGAKTASGGAKRFRELARIMRRHGRRRYPPGYFNYGLNTYLRISCDQIEKWTPGFLSKPSQWFRARLVSLAYSIARWIVDEAQGLYSDGWAATRAYYMLPPGNGQLRLSGSLPRLSGALKGQTIRVECNGKSQQIPIDYGDFDFVLSVPQSKEPANIVLVASRWFVPSAEGLGPDRRRLAYFLRALDWAK
jgi:glycosyltransferase involved in cell wall biosynthesis